MLPREGRSPEIAILAFCNRQDQSSYPIDSEPLGTLGTQSKTGTKSLWSLCSLIDLAHDGFEDTEDAVKLPQRCQVG